MSILMATKVKPIDVLNDSDVVQGNNYIFYNKSCVDMREVKDSTVSLVLTDPPYFIDGMDDKWDNKKLHQRTKPGVVGGIPAGQKFDVNQGVRLQGFLGKVGKECYRVMKPGGFMLCFSQSRLSHRAAMALEVAGFEIRDMIAWEYEGQAKAFTQNHFVQKMKVSDAEKKSIIEKLQGRKTPQLKPKMELIIVAQKPKEGTFVDNWLKYETGLIDVSNPLIEPNKFPGTVIPCKKPRVKYNHMTVKPVDLCRHLIRIFSKEGDMVLDPFCGTGTTGVASLIEDRRCIGYEIDTDMMYVIKHRIENETIQQGNLL